MSRSRPDLSRSFPGSFKRPGKLPATPYRSSAEVRDLLKEARRLMTEDPRVVERLTEYAAEERTWRLNTKNTH